MAEAGYSTDKPAGKRACSYNHRPTDHKKIAGLAASQMLKAIGREHRAGIKTTSGKSTRDRIARAKTYDMARYACAAYYNESVHHLDLIDVAYSGQTTVSGSTTSTIRSWQIPNTPLIRSRCSQAAETLRLTDEIVRSSRILITSKRRHESQPDIKGSAAEQRQQQHGTARDIYRVARVIAAAVRP